MSNNQLAGFPAFGPRVDSTVIYNPAQTILETPLELPVGSYPETAQVQITIATGHLPSFYPHHVPWANDAFSASHYKCLLVAVVRNLAGLGGNVYAMYKTANTPSWASLQQYAIDQWYSTFSLPGLTTWSIGDVQEIKLQAQYAGMYLVGYGLVIIPHYLGSGLQRPLYDFKLKTDTTGIFSTWTGYAHADISASLQTSTGSVTLGSGTINTAIGAVVKSESNGLFTMNMVEKSYMGTGTTYYCPTYPTRIAYTPIL